MLIHLVIRRAVLPLLFVVLAAGEAWAQFDFVGSWAPLGTEDVQNDSLPADYLGLALTDEARTRALSYDESQKSMIERQCAGWGAAYLVLGPFGLRVTAQTDAVNNRVTSYTIGAWEDWSEMVIWMDGRPHPSENALHTNSGFTTGHWEGGALAAHTTHIKPGFIRKTGVPLTDEATIDWRFYRHGDILTILMVATDPVYLVEPEIVSKSFRISRTPLDYRSECVTAYEGHEPGDSVPHFGPDQNPFADEFMKLYHLPKEAVLGYRDTLYPEYRKKIKDTYVPPPPCTESCGAAGNFVLRRQ
ncbi:MAG TPA: hypothetical protein VKY31_08460 [Terriglobia bacterium]|nr:hypothetical protein [Terriglobia bacterium]